MERYTRNYLIGLAALGIVVLISVYYESPVIGRLNDRLAANADVAAYPYRFRVLDLDQGVAMMGTPRSPEFSAHRALMILFPELADEPLDSEVLVAAQQEMARIQYIARDIVEQSADVDRVSWKLDESWLRSNGVDPDLL
jgi:hypothetical protein